MKQTNDYTKYNAEAVLREVEILIDELETELVK